MGGSRARRRLALLALACCGQLSHVAGQTTSTQTDQQRLLTQKDAIPNWDDYAAANAVAGWVADNSVPVCTWTGVTCNEEGRIEVLRLECPTCPLKATGSISGNLSAILPLKTLNLQQQQLGGTLPAEFGGNTSFPSLINLLLQQNQITGTIPSSWGVPGSFQNMNLLTLHFNNVTGPLPEPESWPVLQIMRIQNNQLSGTLPATWPQSMPNLRILSAHENQLQGDLPAEWAPDDAFPLLEELYLQENKLKGNLPTGDIAIKFRRLRIVDLSYNNFAGTLAPSWGLPDAAPELELLKLRSIGLNGTLPVSWGAPEHGLRKMRQLWLDGNDLSGTIPESWTDLKNLSHLFIKPGNDRLCGPVPVDLPFQLCDASGNTECNVTAKLDGPTCSPWNPLPTPDPASDDGSNTAAIVGGVVGGVVGGAVLAVAAVLLLRRRRRAKQRMSPFIAEASTTLDPAPDDMCGFSKVLGNLEGGALGPDKEPSGPWHSRMLHHVSHLFTRAGSASTQPSTQPPPSPLSDGANGGAPAAPAAAGAAAAAAHPPEKLPSGGAVATRGSSLLSYQNDSVLLSSCNGFLAVEPVLSGRPRPSGDDFLEAGIPHISDWEIQPEEIEYMKRADGSDWELGCGGFGKVYKAMRNGAQPVAVKVLNSGADNRYMAMQEFKKEIAILKACRDPNVVAFLGASLREDCAMLVTEYCEGGNLARNIVARKVNWYRRGRKIAIDIAKGLVFLHSRRIVHLDIKSPNVLLSRDGTAKVADVGLAKIIAQEYSAVTGTVGTLAWSSPEMLLGARCTEKSDIYSYGVVLWEIATGQTPIRGQLRDVKVPEECPEELRKLMLDCLEQNPRRRPSAQQLIERLCRIPVSPQEHVPALPPQQMRPESPAEAAAAAAAKAHAAAAQAQATAAASEHASEHAAGAQDARQQDDAAPPAPVGVPGSPQAPVSAFAAAAATAAEATPRTASNAGELLSKPSASLSPLPGAFTGRVIAPATSLPSPFGNKQQSSSSFAEAQLPAWSSSDDLGSTEASRTASATTPGAPLSRAVSNTLGGRWPSMQAQGGVRAPPGKPPLPPAPPSP